MAFRSVLRPSSPLGAKASTKCPSTLDLYLSIRTIRPSAKQIDEQPYLFALESLGSLRGHARIHRATTSRSQRAERAILLQTLRRFVEAGVAKARAPAPRQDLRLAWHRFDPAKRQYPLHNVKQQPARTNVLASQARQCPISSSPIRPNSRPSPRKASAGGGGRD